MPLIKADVFHSTATLRSTGREPSVAVKVVQNLKLGEAFHYDLEWIETNMSDEKSTAEATSKIVSRINSYSTKLGKPNGFKLRTRRVIDVKADGQPANGVMVLKVALPPDGEESEGED